MDLCLGTGVPNSAVLAPPTHLHVTEPHERAEGSRRGQKESSRAFLKAVFIVCLWLSLPQPPGPCRLCTHPRPDGQGLLSSSRAGSQGHPGPWCLAWQRGRRAGAQYPSLAVAGGTAGAFPRRLCSRCQHAWESCLGSPTWIPSFTELEATVTAVQGG